MHSLLLSLLLAGFSSDDDPRKPNAPATAASDQPDDARIAEIRRRRRERKALYNRLHDAVRDAHLKNAPDFLRWLPNQPYPDDFKAELKRRVQLALDATRLAWRDALKHSDDVLRTADKDDRVLSYLIEALRHAGRQTDAKDLATRFAPDLRLPKRRDRGRREIDLHYAAERYRLAGDREALERLAAKLAAEPKPTDRNDRYWRHKFLEELAHTRRQFGDAVKADEAERLAEEFADPKEAAAKRVERRSKELFESLGLEKALVRARTESIQLEQAVLLRGLHAGQLDAVEKAYWEMLPRLAKADERKINAANLAVKYFDRNDPESTERVLRKAAQTTPVLCDKYAGNILLETYDPATRADLPKRDRLAAPLLALASAATTLTPNDRAQVVLDVAFAKAVMGQRDEARRLVASVGAIDRTKEYMPGWIELFTGPTEDTWKDVNRWVDSDWSGLYGLDDVLEWELPPTVLRELLPRLEAIKPGDLYTHVNKNRTVVKVAAELGLVEHAKAAIRRNFKHAPAHTADLILDADLDDFGWEGVQALPFDDDHPDRCTVAARLAHEIFSFRIWLD